MLRGAQLADQRRHIGGGHPILDDQLDFGAEHPGRDIRFFRA
jgi:hypothetical protein